MEGSRKKKKRNSSEYQYQGGEDRISALPDDVIHQILKFVDTKLGVQTSVLSKRWKLVWTSLPFLKFQSDEKGSSKNKTNLTRHVLNHRNHLSRVSSLELSFLPPALTDRFVKYAISAHVEHLVVHLQDKHKPYKLSNLSSNSMKNLELILLDSVSHFDSWDLPALTSLHLCHLVILNVHEFLPVQCLNCLPALTTLRLSGWDFRKSGICISLPELTTLHLSECYLPQKVWNLPALKTLTLYDVEFCGKMSDLLAALVSLQNLTLDMSIDLSMQDCVISCPQLINLEIKTHYYSTYKGRIVVLAPKLVNFTSVGIFPITFGDSNLENVYLKLRDWIEDGSNSLKKLKRYYQEFKSMIPGLARAKILNLDLATIEALSSISGYLASCPSPFCNLKYVKLPYRCEEASICSTLRSYLTGASPKATFITTMPQNIILHTAAASLTAQNIFIKDTSAAPTKLFIDSENMHKTVCGDAVDLVVQEEHVVQNSELDADRIIHVGTPSKVTCNCQVGSSRGNSDSGFWQGHEVNPEFACLLDQVLNNYPETFEQLTTKNKFSTMKINMLCTAIIDFTKIPMTEVSTKMITEYRDVFSDLQKLGFNVSWLVNRLNSIEQLQISQPLLLELHAIDCQIDDAKCKLQDLQIRIDESKLALLDLQTLRAEKMQEIQKAFGTMDTNIAVGRVGENLFSGP